MPATADILTTLNTSTKLDPVTRDILTQFLTAGAPLFDALEASALRDLMNWLAGQSIPAPATIDHLTAAQVSALLATTQEEMNLALDQRAKQVAATRAAVENLSNVALTLVVRLILSAL